MNIIKILLSFLAIFTFVSLGNSCFAQSLSFKSDDPERPIEVYADSGIEWQRDRNLFIARGSAKAIQGNVHVSADELIAHYREYDGGNTDVFRVDAIGNVLIQSEEETAIGTGAVYDFKLDVLVIEGSPVRLETVDGVVLAYDTIQYWGSENIAVAKGRALAEREGQKLFADILTARFNDTVSNSRKIGKSKFTMIEGYGNVRLETDGDVILGERGRYDLAAGLITLAGNVRFSSENNRMRGEFAVVDTDTGVSSLFPSAQKAGVPGLGKAPRVSALVVPRPKSLKDITKED